MQFLDLDQSNAERNNNYWRRIQIEQNPTFDRI